MPGTRSSRLSQICNARDVINDGHGIRACTAFSEWRREIMSRSFEQLSCPQFSASPKNRLLSIKACVDRIDVVLSSTYPPSPSELPPSIYADTVDELRNTNLLTEDVTTQQERECGTKHAKGCEALGSIHAIPGRPISTLIWNFAPKDSHGDFYKDADSTVGYTVSVSWELQITPGKLDATTLQIRPLVMCVQELAPSLRYPSDAAKFLASNLHCLPPELHGTGQIHTYGYAELAVVQARDVMACPAWVPRPSPGMPHPPHERRDPRTSLPGLKRAGYLLEKESEIESGPPVKVQKREPSLHPVSPQSSISNCCSDTPGASSTEYGRESTATSDTLLYESTGSGEGSQFRRQKRENDEEEGEEEEEDGARPPRDRLQQPGLGGPLRRFACPFYKNNITKYRHVRTCCGPGWKDIHRLKGHLFDCHSQSTRCRRCKQAFKKRPMLIQHESQPPGNCIEQVPKVDLMTKNQEELVKKRGMPFASQVDRWKQIYDILFPSDSLDVGPSPYYDEHPCSPSTPGSELTRLRSLFQTPGSQIGLEARYRIGTLVQQHFGSTTDVTQEIFLDRCLTTIWEIIDAHADTQPAPQSRTELHPFQVPAAPRPRVEPVPMTGPSFQDIMIPLPPPDLPGYASVAPPGIDYGLSSTPANGLDPILPIFDQSLMHNHSPFWPLVNTAIPETGFNPQPFDFETYPMETNNYNLDKPHAPPQKD